MGELVSMEGRQSSRAARARRRRYRTGAVRVFPGPRHVSMIQRIATHMAKLTDAEAREFLVFHFDIEEQRLIAHGISDSEIDRYTFETSRAIWARMSNIKSGVA